MDLPNNIFIWILSFTTLWTACFCNSDIPTRIANVFISGNDPGLKLTNESLCSNDTERSINFQRLMINGNFLYIGATNHILQVDLSTFSLDQFKRLGPYQDDPGCIAPAVCSDCDRLRCQDDENRLLLPHRNQLIVCGSTFKGTCDILTLGNVEQPYTPAPNVQKLKCENDMPQITKCPDAVASIFTDANDGKKDLFYLGHHCQSPSVSRVLIPPDADQITADIGFHEIIKANTYLPKTDKYEQRTFVATWSTDTHNFMVSINEDTTTLTRLCHSTMNEFEKSSLTEEDYGQTSYTETTVQCGEYVRVEKAVYQNGRLYMLMSRKGQNKGQFSYALCSVEQVAINRHFDEARRSCLLGRPALAELIDGERCPTNIKDVKDSYVTCGLPQSLTHFLKAIRCKGILELVKDFIWPAAMAAPTSIAAKNFDESTVGFFGTSDGYIYKAQIGNSATKFAERIQLDLNLPVLADTNFDPSSQHIYMMSKNKVFKVPLSNCEQYDTCEKCVESADPYCGWCVLQSRCSHKSECKATDPQHWLNTTVSSSRCPRVFSISPNSLSVADAQELSLTFGGSQLPGYEYQCHFIVGDTSLHNVSLKNFPSSPTCQSPSEPPNIPNGQDHVNVTLEIKASDAVVATGTFTIYDCRNIPGINKGTMCGSCVTSSWNCVWCQTSNTCEDSCSNSVGTSAKDECPVVVQVEDLKVDVPVGKAHEFTLVTKNLPELHNFFCALEVCESTSEVLVPGTRDEENITCSVPENQLNCPKEDSTIVLSLKSGDYYVDTPRPETVTVGLFNCSGAEAECGLCIISHGRHPECSWCVSQQTCVPQEDCGNSGITAIDSCPAPKIEYIRPLNGPMNGGTEITIEGTNLASNHTEIVAVFVRDDQGGDVDVNCTMLPEKYIPSKRIVCLTDGASSVPSGGKIHVRTSYTTSEVTSDQEFQFKEVTATKFSPEYALTGTKIRIEGTNLDVGNEANLVIYNRPVEKSSTCHNRLPDSLECIVPDSDIGPYSVRTMLDGFSKNMVQRLQYVETPAITGLAVKKKLVSFYKGGLLAKFKLTSLHGIQTAVLVVNKGEAEQDCRFDQNSTLIICPIPAMESLDTNKNGRSKRAVGDEADADNPATSRAADPTPVSAEIVINDQLRIPLNGSLTLSYVSNPVVNPLSTLPCRSSDTQTATSNQGSAPTSSNATQNQPAEDESETVTVQLTGKQLDSAAYKEDYSIKITPLEGAKESVNCVPKFLDSDSLICKASAEEMKKYEGMDIIVTVSVGNLTFPLKTKFCPDGGGGFSGGVIAAIIVVVVLLVIIIIFLICLQRYRAAKQRKEREQIMVMLDKLENKTRENARKAYSELQLGYMTKLTDNISDSITYLPPVSCIMRALFNDWKPDHPMLLCQESDDLSRIRAGGLDEFIQLLKNRDFLITFVKTLEEQKHFTVKEKGNFASLLTVCLFDDLNYFTKIMLELLSELIQKHVGKNPKLLLRRSESVVEKMVSHWLCINLYSECIVDQAGKPLFLLTKAIHFLVSSAPSDVVANKAINSLNEMTLLGTEIKYEGMTLTASVVEKEEKTGPYQVKVVNCDTITQVKEKIIEVAYRDRPYSEWPKPDNMELDLVAGEGHIVLSDIDNMSHQDTNYTQINTLKHYNVPDGAAVVLSPIQTKMNGAAETGDAPSEPKKRRLYHLIHPRDKEPNGFIEEDDSGNKTKALIGNLINQPFQEIYLTRMVKSKTTVQEYVDAVFNAILSPSPISRSVKYFFQYLDKEAAKHKINDPEVLHIWKNNSLLLRYWVNTLKNPEFLFDINKTAIVDSCLNVITQAFMDACTTTNHKLGQDSPSNKLLYAKDAEKYKEMVSKFFVNVSNEEVVTDAEITSILKEVSRKHQNEFNQRSAAQDLYNYLDKYRSQVMEAMENDQQLYSRLNEIVRTLSPGTNGHTHETSVLV